VWDIEDATHNLLIKITGILREHETGLMKINQLTRLCAKNIKLGFQLMTSLQISFTEQKTIISKE